MIAEKTHYRTQKKLRGAKQPPLIPVVHVQFMYKNNTSLNKIVDFQELTNPHGTGDFAT